MNNELGDFFICFFKNMALGPFKLSFVALSLKKFGVPVVDDEDNELVDFFICPFKNILSIVALRLKRLVTSVVDDEDDELVELLICLFENMALDPFK